MENQIKVGQSFEVVKVLTDGGYSDKSLFKIGGYTIGKQHSLLGGIRTLSNGENIHNHQNLIYLSPLEGEIKRVGKLTITKIK